MTAMGWFITADVGEFLTEAGEFLRAEPARHSVVLTVTENLLLTATAAPGPGPDEPSFGWWQPDPVTAVAAVFMYTPEFPVLLSSRMSGSAAAELAHDLAAAGHQVPGINAGQEAADAFAASWRDRTGERGHASRLPPGGRPRGLVLPAGAPRVTLHP